jgi:hypothetical protein
MPYQINRIILLLIVSSGVFGCRKNDAPRADAYIDPATQPSELSRAFKVENGQNYRGNAPVATTTSNLLISKYQPTALITSDNYLFIPLIGQTSETVNGIYFQVAGADNYWVVNTPLATDRSQVISMEVPANVLNGKFEILYGLKGVNGGIGKPVNLKVEVISRIEYCSNSQAPQLIQGNDGLVSYSFTFGDQVGWVTIDYDTYTVPDRIDVRYNKEWIASTGNLLATNKPPTKLCSSVTAGDGFVGRSGSFKIYYDGSVSKKLDVYVSGCLDGGTQWEFKIRGCPTNWYSELPDCPCNYSQVQALGQTSSPNGRWEACGNADPDFHYGATFEARWLPAVEGWPGQQCTYTANGKLITKGIAAGSPDKVSPGACGPWSWIFSGTGTLATYTGHRDNDMNPWKTKPCWEYLTNWPANNKLGCSPNVVSGVSHMQTMIGDMTCEQATLLIKSAKESTAIDAELKNYILGNLSYTPVQLKSKLIAWRTTNSCSSSSPSSLCKVIDMAIANL